MTHDGEGGGEGGGEGEGGGGESAAAAVRGGEVQPGGRSCMQ